MRNKTRTNKANKKQCCKVVFRVLKTKPTKKNTNTNKKLKPTKHRFGIELLTNKQKQHMFGMKQKVSTKQNTNTNKHETIQTQTQMYKHQTRAKTRNKYKTLKLLNVYSQGCQYIQTHTHIAIL